MNGTGDYKLAVFIPVYNELDNLLRLEEAMDAFCHKSLLQPVCVMLFDDGSTDGSSDLLESICARHDNFFKYSFAKNSGVSAVWKEAARICEAPYLAQIDADLQTAPEDFNRLIPYLGEYDLVAGERERRNDNIVRIISSRVGNAVRRHFTHDGVRDTCCPLKIIHTSIAKDIPMLTGLHRFIPALVLAAGGKVKTVPVRHFPRIAGKAKFGVWNRFAGPLGDCFGVRWMMRRCIRSKAADNNSR